MNFGILFHFCLTTFVINTKFWLAAWPFCSVRCFIRFKRRTAIRNNYVWPIYHVSAVRQRDSFDFDHVDDSRRTAPSLECNYTLTIAEEGPTARRLPRLPHLLPFTHPPSEQISHQPAARRPRRTASPSDRLQRGSVVKCQRLMKTLKKI